MKHLLIFLFMVGFCLAVTNTTTGAGNWADVGTWDQGHVPLITEDVEIAHDVTMNVVTANALSITNAGGGTLTANTATLTTLNCATITGDAAVLFTIIGTATLTVNCDTFTTAGSIGMQTATASNIIINGVVTGGVTAPTIKSTSSGSITVNGDVNGGSGSGGYGINTTSSCAITVNGDVTGGTGNYLSSGIAAQSSSAGDIIVNGTLNYVTGKTVPIIGFGVVSFNAVSFDGAIVSGQVGTLYKSLYGD